ncbi:LacI family DNA-binding transcriptional regulator [Schaalia vaccimaxillae]|uniref:LacI family DNA-binding transcriptional regulator n=1 Tax=Schaalia vaccimaxillae TaxID=183916 RepID=UPI0003B4841B|nr:LacI family DNA-binding transcriptional regulator [Schaalia vaccimaxillae]
MPLCKEPTLADVAEKAGVSLTTVSRVLNNRGYLSEATKTRVADAIAELGYRPNQVARALHGMKTNMIGLIVPTVALPFFGELAVEVENVLAEHGYRTLICNSMGRADREREYLNLLIGNRVDGIISGAHNENLAEYESIRMPLVTVDRDLTDRIPNIRCNNEDAGRIATRRLIDGGAHRPALLTSRSGDHNLRERGYRSVLAEAGIEPLVFAVPFDTDPRHRQAMVNEALDGAKGSFDAVFSTDDLGAAEAIEWARTRELSVPEDLRVIGFDGTMALRRALPGLTTLHQPLDLIARQAVKVLLAQIDARSSEDESDDARVTGRLRPRYEFPAELVEGWTA